MESGRPHVERVAPHTRAAAEAFLARYEDSAIMLLGNLAKLGPDLTEHPNSGNFKVVLVDGEVRAVFCLVRRGNLLIQFEFGVAYPALVVEAALGEDVALTGFVGPWSSVEPVLTHFRSLRPDYKPTVEERCFLYVMALDGNAQLPRNSNVRYLVPADFPDIHHLRHGDLEDEFPLGMSADQERTLFAEQALERSFWGYVADGRVVATVATLSRTARAGLVGAVYTMRTMRRKGLSRAAMLHMLADCRDDHGHVKSVLFTENHNLAAQAMYESIGYERRGEFSMIIG